MASKMFIGSGRFANNEYLPRRVRLPTQSSGVQISSALQSAAKDDRSGNPSRLGCSLSSVSHFGVRADFKRLPVCLAHRPQVCAEVVAQTKAIMVPEILKFRMMRDHQFQLLLLPPPPFLDVVRHLRKELL